MRKHRFFIQAELNIHSEIVLDEDTSHYINRVLRLKDTAAIYLFNNSGFEYQSTITKISKHHVTVRVAAATVDAVESPFQIHLAQVIGKSDKMDLVIQKTTELGVLSIIPLYSEHTVVKNISDRNAHKLDHWQKIAAAASAQSGRNFVPTIHAPLLLSEWITTINTTHKLILHPSKAAQLIKTVPLQESVTILIGPEGGFSEHEILMAQQQDFIPIALGPRILRTETAGLATIAILQALYGDL